MNYRKFYSDYFGIKIPKGYVIHHIDGDRSNNDIYNLLLLPQKLHSKYHFYKAIIDSWDKSSNLNDIYGNTYLLNALAKFSKVCHECFEYYRIKKHLEMGCPPESLGFERKG